MQNNIVLLNSILLVVFFKHKKRLFGKIGTYTQKKECGFEIDDLDDLRIVNSVLDKIQAIVVKNE